MLSKLKGRISAILVAMFGITVLIMIPYQVGTGESTVMGPKEFPYFLSVLIIILSFISVLTHKNTNVPEDRETNKDQETKADEKRLIFPILLVFLCLLCWIFLEPVLGFVLTSLFFVGAVMWVIGSRNPVHLILVPIIFSVIIYFIFIVLLKLSLPAGILF